MYKKILVATDGSDYTKKATNHAIELAKLSGAELHAIYVIDTRYGCGPESCILTDTSSERLKSILGCQGDTAIKYIEKLANKEGIHTERWIVEGNPAEEIVRLAEELSVDLIVMGTLGSSGIPRFLLGSVADKVIRTSRIPVLTVRK
ncbi:MAG: universal stress protein [Candidatus Methanoperedens sp.]|nr:universal stress protein [Candidatus Methanoperedens sp.]